MIATLASYDRLFGPRHVQTLCLAVKIAEVLSESGEKQSARRLLERVVRDLASTAGRAHAARISAIAALRDLLRETGDIAGAIAAQKEITECWILLAGSESMEATTARSELGDFLMLADPAAA